MANPKLKSNQKPTTTVLTWGLCLTIVHRHAVPVIPHLNAKAVIKGTTAFAAVGTHGGEAQTIPDNQVHFHQGCDVEWKLKHDIPLANTRAHTPTLRQKFGRFGYVQMHEKHNLLICDLFGGHECTENGTWPYHALCAS